MLSDQTKENNMLIFIGSLEAGAYSDRRTYVVSIGTDNERVESETIEMYERIKAMAEKYRDSNDVDEYLGIAEEFGEMTGDLDCKFMETDWEWHVDAFDKPLTII